jgi:hypothetical protein
MADPQVISALKAKQHDIQASIASYERALDIARRDLANVNAVMAMYGREQDPESWQAHMSVAKVFRRGEIFAICEEALKGAEGGLDTRQLAEILLQRKGMDSDDPILRRTIAYNIVQILGSRLKRGTIGSPGKRRGVRVWEVA